MNVAFWKPDYFFVLGGHGHPRGRAVYPLKIALKVLARPNSSKPQPRPAHPAWSLATTTTCLDKSISQCSTIQGSHNQVLELLTYNPNQHKKRHKWP